MDARIYALERNHPDAYAGCVSSLGMNIRMLRERAGFETQVALAAKMGIKSQTISDWENDRRKGLDMDSLLKLAVALHVSIDEVVRNVDDRYDSIIAAQAGVQNSTQLHDYESVKPDLAPSSSKVGVDVPDSKARSLEAYRSAYETLESEVTKVVAAFARSFEQAQRIVARTEDDAPSTGHAARRQHVREGR